MTIIDATFRNINCQGQFDRRVFPLPALMLTGSPDMITNLETNYEYFSGWNDIGPNEFDCNENWTSDPERHIRPLCEIKPKTGWLSMYIYEFGVVMLKENGVFTKWTRCD